MGNGEDDLEDSGEDGSHSSGDLREYRHRICDEDLDCEGEDEEGD